MLKDILEEHNLGIRTLFFTKAKAQVIMFKDRLMKIWITVMRCLHSSG